MKFIRLAVFIGVLALAVSGCKTSETQVSTSCKYIVDADAPDMTRAEACGYEKPKELALKPNLTTGLDTLLFLTSIW